VSATGDIATVLDEIRAVAAELVEIKTDVKLALSHGGDIEKLLADVKRIDEHLQTIDEFMAGPPALQERLAALEKKQEKDRKTAARETTDAGAKQEGVNVGFREKFAELFSGMSILQNASIRNYGIGLVLGVAVVSILLKITGLS
jgi:hypothetical protein